jgi:hypothetical protein
VYGVEAQATGVGGLASQAPPDVYFPEALAAAGVNESPLIGSPPRTGVSMPYTNIGDQQPSGLMAGTASASGQAVRVPVSQQQPHWSAVLDFHSSVAPWILLAILVLYGWLHLSFRARGGPARAAFAV